MFEIIYSINFDATKYFLLLETAKLTHNKGDTEEFGEIKDKFIHELANVIEGSELGKHFVEVDMNSTFIVYIENNDIVLAWTPHIQKRTLKKELSKDIELIYFKTMRKKWDYSSKHWADNIDQDIFYAIPLVDIFYAIPLVKKIRNKLRREVRFIKFFDKFKKKG